jgi:multidrug efflux pump subunit AcrA (membrane-fusion protein)
MQRSRFYKILLTFVIVSILILIAFSIAGGPASNATTATPDRIAQVKLYNFDTASSSDATIETTGLIESRSQVNLQAETQGLVSFVNVSLGDSVYAGQLLVQLNTADIDASVAQAAANLAVQEIRLQELQRGARQEERSILEARFAQTQASLEASQVSVSNAIRDGITRADDAISTIVDSLFIDPRTPSPSLIFNPYDYQIKVDVERDRPIAGNILTFWKNELSANIPDPSLQELAMKAESDLIFLKKFVDRLSQAVNALEPSNSIPASTITTWQSGISATRSGIDAGISTLRSSVEGYKQALSGVAIVENELALSDAGASAEQLQIQQASVAAAKAQLASLEAQRGKYSIRTPISGEISELNIDAGALITPGARVATIINTSGLQITAFVDTADARRISAGTQFIIADTHEGSVRYVSPAINQETKKVEVIGDIIDGSQGLYVGSFEDISFRVKGVGTQVPLTAIRSRGGEDLVLSVSEDGTVMSHKVTIGEVQGNMVGLMSALPTGVESIIEDARGINIGDPVIVTSE